MSAHSIVGASHPAVGAREKVRGESQYVGDMTRPRMLHARVLRSLLPHARIAAVDASRALRLPGVKAVLSGADIPCVRWGQWIRDQTALAIGKVRFVGEEVAAVAATDPDVAEEALEAIQVEYEELPPVFSPEEAMAEGAPLLHEGVERNIAYSFHIERGNVKEGFASASTILEDTYETSIQYQAYMEPMGALAETDSGGRVTVWAPVQMIYYAREKIAQALDVPLSRVRVIQTTVGGAFGGKSVDDPVVMIAALLSQRTGRSVRLLNSRVDEFAAARPRVPYRIRLKMGLRKDGLIAAKETWIVGDNGAYCGHAVGILAATVDRMDNCYRQKHIQTNGHLVYTNKIPTGPFRGFGNPQMCFAFESHLDVLADMIGMDPAEVRLKNATQTGDTTVHGWKVGSSGLTEAIKRCSELSGWRERYPPREGVRRGMGMACAIHVSANRHFANWDGAEVLVKINEDGGAQVICGEGDIGQGANTVLSQFVAHELGTDLSRVVISEADTDTTPFSFGAYGSRLTLIAGNAARRAAAEVRRQLLAVAAEILEAREEDLELGGGWISLRSRPDRRISLGEVARSALFRKGGAPILGRGSYDAPTEMAPPETRYGNIAPAYEFAVHVAEVEVDTETGCVALTRYFAADDLGRVINPLGAEGQVHGGVAQGLGFGLWEQMIIEGGKVVNGSFADYALPRAEGLPRLSTLLIESNEPNGPLGAKGVSEACIDPVAAAVANAIRHATGVRFTSLPITAQKVLAGLKSATRT